MSLSKVPAASLSGLIPGPNTSQVNGIHANGAIPASYVPGFIYLDSTTTAATLPASTAVTAYSTVTLQNTTPGAFITISTAAGDNVFWSGNPVTSFPLPYLDVVELIQAPGFGWFVKSKGRNRQAGAVLQVIGTEFNSPFGISLGATPADVSGFSVSITPSSVTSKILVMVTANMGGDNDTYPYLLLKRNGTPIGNGNLNGVNGTAIFAGGFFTNIGTPIQYTTKNVSKNLIDSPNTASAITYQIAMASPYLGSAYLNRQANQVAGASYTQTPGSSIIAMEIAG